LLSLLRIWPAIGGRIGIDSAASRAAVKAALGLALLVSPCSGWAAYQSKGFPPAHELFAPLLADSSDPHFAFSLGAEEQQRGIARVDLGDYLGIYRLALPGELGAVQLNIGGAIFTRFDAVSHDIQVIDYYGNVPVDIRMGRAAARLMFYHDSSHLGDDYLKERGIQTIAHSWEALRGILAFNPVKPLRLYGGYTKALHTKPAWAGYQAVQGGVEIYFNTSANAHWHPYWANDIQVWERTAWDPLWTSQLGLKTAADYSKGRGITYFVQVMKGPRLEGQFYTQTETVWSAGLKFALSLNLLSPSEQPSSQDDKK
ncbi:MAG: hypothetical protein A3J79_10115, partial [Elusimicrobia bacterium RIFOXYB2_FULL_62_6]